MPRDSFFYLAFPGLTTKHLSHCNGYFNDVLHHVVYAKDVVMPKIMPIPTTIHIEEKIADIDTDADSKPIPKFI